MRRNLLPAIAFVAAFAALHAPTAAAQSTKARSSAAAKRTDDAKLRTEAKITEAAARVTALKEIPAGKIRSGELERENGKLIYSFDIKVAGKSGIEEVQVDAITGLVVSNVHETPKMEKAEAAADKKEKKALRKP